MSNYPDRKRKPFIIEAFLGIKSLLIGMWITLRHFVQKPITIQYPDEKIETQPRFRGYIRLVRDEQKGIIDCGSCQGCVKVCPVDIISCTGIRDENNKLRFATYELDYSRCLFCGLCLEACPTHVLQVTDVYELAEYSRDGLKYYIKNPDLPAEVVDEVEMHMTVERPTAPWLAGGATMRKFYDEGKVDSLKAEANVPPDGPTAEMAKKGKAFSAERARKALEAKKKADEAKAAKAAAEEKSGNPVADTPGESKKADQ
jgi:NADH-quinone oxidoreductase subunit I